ncbi:MULTISPECIES: hypothetical protein [Chromobacterium]|uniref:hypothetical protein n=1 Tax=Chromobacterium TaxID=535 RepID=UPI00188782CA|nr:MULTISPECIES: hypothetical protein [Chromobacterium]QOZ83758.1 hypothetical protein DXT74_12205 [Chromobacterium sp. Rain0013]WON83894.1 phage integrase SAM-like domain-containing protein [Chromobacterium haemolyticum]
MGKRKVFSKTDLSVPQVEHSREGAGRIVVLSGEIPPAKTTVSFGRNVTRMQKFDFARWYARGIDPITYACQRQIERFLVRQDDVIEATTVASHCKGGLRHFLDYLVLRATSLNRGLTLADIDRALIDDFLGYLSDLGISPHSQRGHYSNAKSILNALGRRGLFPLVTAGDDATFPRNPFPNIGPHQGETPLPKRQRQALAMALRQAVMPIFHDDVQVTGELLAYALLTVALHTGRNATPLLEMGADCLHPHPKDGSVFMVLRKRRGYTSSKIALRGESGAERWQESTPTVKTNVERLVRRVLTLGESLRAEAPGDFKERVWLYRVHRGSGLGRVIALNGGTVAQAIKKLVAEHGLTDTDGQPLRINISRLRKTFANRIFELLEGDIATTAIALGNTPQVTGKNYLAPSNDAKRNWQFMGKLLVEELMTGRIGATYHTTAMGRCSDPVYGQHAPKQEGATCFSFLNCLRCKHYAVTGDDLHRLFSFYFRVLAERARMNKRRWEREYAHIPRLIDNYIVAEGLRRGVFKPATVETERERARREAHPFWSCDAVDNLGVFA